MSEIMWEIVENFNNQYGYVLDLRESFLKERAPTYEKAIMNGVAPLKKRDGFIDFTKIKMCRPGGHNSYSRSV